MGEIRKDFHHGTETERIFQSAFDHFRRNGRGAAGAGRRARLREGFRRQGDDRRDGKRHRGPESRREIARSA